MHKSTYLKLIAQHNHKIYQTKSHIKSNDNNEENIKHNNSSMENITNITM